MLAGAKVELKRLLKVEMRFKIVLGFDFESVLNLSEGLAGKTIQCTNEL
jgi:hypothetical protein